MFSDQGRAFLREIGIAAEPGFSVAFGGEDITKCVRDCRTSWVHDAFAAPLIGEQADLARRLIADLRREIDARG